MRNKILKGFTLVELLVVVCIIGLLAALLLPAMSASVRKSKMIKCGNNLKQFATALQLFYTDNKDHFPPAQKGLMYSVDASINITWDDALADYMGRKLSLANKQASFVTPAMMVENGCLQCPSDKRREDANRVPIGYSMNGRSAPVAKDPLGPPVSSSDSWRVTDVGDPTGTLLFMDEDDNSGSNWVGNPSKLNGINSRTTLLSYSASGGTHGKSTFNFLYCDGHQATINVMQGFTNNSPWTCRED